MAFGDDFGDFLLHSLSRRKSQSFQLIHHHQHQHSPTWSLPGEETESLADYTSSRQLAAMLQRQFDEEDYLLATERADLLAAAEQQRVFDCGVCLDTLPEEFIARIDPCGHSFCRECVRGLITSQIETRRFPVLCPTCTAQPENSRPELIGKVTHNLVLEIGITREQYEVWTEMEMAEFFILLQCRRCGQSSYLDREGFNEARNLHCPMEGCRYVWCKECQQEFVPNGPEHSCDGSSELKRLVEQQGWKYCPVCNTPCEKISGCNNVSCIAPGCRSNFCYNCGGWLTRPATAISQGRSNEESRCRC
ncbi:hypothetical protein BGY98DRAFT_372360 [Russula aff. rugulosa BPL654]|nr:hypothetical protein BGY98DRAFT_372360 [Russula aff. rugulosa BPL654]